MKIRPHLRDVLEYRPVASRFGTSGVRALVKDLTDLEVYSLTLGTLRYLETVDKVQLGSSRRKSLHIPFGGDLRPSTKRILGATARAILDAGYQLDYVGTLPTPALTFYALEKGILSFMCTGSHIPADRNGQKANRCDGEVLKSDEQGIVEAVEAVRQQEYERSAEESKFDSSGMLKPEYRVSLPPANPSAEDLYFERYRRVFPRNGLSGMRILFYQYSAVGRDLLPRILEHFGANVICAGRSNEFVPIDTEAISEAHLRMLSAIVADRQVVEGRIDAVVSTDGDSDRPLLLGVSGPDALVAPSLQFFPGDLVGALVADYLAADSISVPISANPAVHEHFLAKGLTTTKTRIGSPYVIQAMRKALAEGRRRVVGWEANGGFLVGSEMTLNKGTLRPLPTRDALLAILAVLYAAAERGSTLADLFARLPQWYGRADLIDNFPQQTSGKILRYFRPPREDVQWLEFRTDRILLRDISEAIIGEWPSGDPNGQAFYGKKQVLEDIFMGARGFGKIERINVQDGIRCFFGNGDIAHIRPSGNAPQLRIYAYAGSQSRANQIAEMAVAEPDGMLRELQRFMESDALDSR
jgi:phosphomannomutase